MFKFEKYITIIVLLFALGGCVPPIPFMETVCLDPISSDDISPQGVVKVKQESNVVLEATAETVYENTEIEFNGSPLTIRVPIGFKNEESPWVSVDSANAIQNSDIVIKDIMGTYYRGPNLFTKPDDNNYGKAYKLGEYSPDKGGYLGKRFIVKNYTSTCVVGVGEGCTATADSYLHGSDLVFITVSEEGKQLYEDESGNSQIQTSFDINGDWVKNNKLSEEASKYGVDEHTWIVQRIMRQLVAVAIASSHFRVFGEPGVTPGTDDTFRELSDYAVRETKKDYKMTRSFMIEKLYNACSDAGCTDISNDSITGLGFRLDIPETDVKANIVIFVKILRNRVQVDLERENGVNMAVVDCDRRANVDTCDLNKNPDLDKTVKENIHEEDTLRVNKDSKVWFKIIPKSGTQQMLYNGNVTVKVETKGESSGASHIYMPIIKIIKKFSLIGLKNTYTGMTGINENGQITSTSFIYLIKTLLMLYIVFMGFQYLTGMAQASTADVVARMLKVGIVTILVDPAGWNFLSNAIFFAIIEFPTVVLRSIDASDLTNNLNAYNAQNWQDLMTQVNADLNDPFFFMNQLIALFFHPEIVKRTFALIIAPGGLVVFILVVAGIVFVLKGFVKALFMYAFSIIMICFMLGISPLFLPFVLFKYAPLKSIFDKYLGIIMRYSLEPVVLFIGLYVIASVFFVIYINMILSLQLCFKCAYPIYLNLEPLGKFGDLLIEFERMLCFWSLMPWGTDNFGVVESLFQGSGVLAVVRYLISGIIILMLGMSYDGFVDKVGDLVQSLTNVQMSGGLGNVGYGGQPQGAQGAYAAIAGMGSSALNSGKQLAKTVGKEIKKRIKSGVSGPKNDSSKELLDRVERDTSVDTVLHTKKGADAANSKLSGSLDNANDNSKSTEFMSEGKKDTLNRLKSELPEEFTEKINHLMNKDVHNDDIRDIATDAMKYYNAQNAFFKAEIAKELDKPTIDRSAVNDRFEKLSQNYNAMSSLNNIQKDLANSQLRNVEDNVRNLTEFRSNESGLNSDERSYYNNLSSREEDLNNQKDHFNQLNTNLNVMQQEIEKSKDSLEQMKNQFTSVMNKDSGPDTDQLNSLANNLDKAELNDLTKQIDGINLDDYKTKDDITTTLENEITSYFSSVSKDEMITDPDSFESTIFNQKMDSLINSYRLSSDQVDSIRSGLLIKAKQAYGL